MDLGTWHALQALGLSISGLRNPADLEKRLRPTTWAGRLTTSSTAANAKLCTTTCSTSGTACTARRRAKPWLVHKGDKTEGKQKSIEFDERTVIDIMQKHRDGTGG